jgi:hypothetical protein
VLEQRQDSPTTCAEDCHARANGMMERSIAPHLEALGGIDWEALVLEGQSSAGAITSHVVSCFIGTNVERLLQDLPVSVLAVR